MTGTTTVENVTGVHRGVGNTDLADLAGDVEVGDTLEVSYKSKSDGTGMTYTTTGTVIEVEGDDDPRLDSRDFRIDAGGEFLAYLHVNTGNGSYCFFAEHRERDEKYVVDVTHRPQ